MPLVNLFFLFFRTIGAISPVFCPVFPFLFPLVYVRMFRMAAAAAPGIRAFAACRCLHTAII